MEIKIAERDIIEKAKQVIIKRAKERIKEVFGTFFSRSVIEDMNRLIEILEYSGI